MSNNYGPKIVTDGLVLCLDAADQNSYSGSGNTWTDLSGNGNNGTLINGPTFTSENYGSIIFDGSNDYINIATFVATLNTLTYSSECYWFKVPLTGGLFFLSFYGNRYNPVGNFTSSSTSERISIYQNNILACYENGNTFYIDNQWHYACYVYGPGFNKLYVDAKELTLRSHWGNSNTTRSADSTSHFILGNRPSDFVGNEGFLSTVSIYSRPLSANEVQQNYNATKGRFGL